MHIRITSEPRRHNDRAVSDAAFISGVKLSNRLIIGISGPHVFIQKVDELSVEIHPD
jgi:hypothetical protein